MIKVALAFLAILLVSAGVFLFFFFDEVKAPNAEQNAQTSTTKQASKPSTKGAEFDTTRHSIEDPGSIWVVVNKRRPIPKTYVPDNLVIPEVALNNSDTSEQMQIRGDISQLIKTMFEAADQQDIKLVFGSGYRSASLQESFYNQYVATNGQNAADTFSARPGHSEHQTGLAFDAVNQSRTCFLETCFEKTDEGKWLIENSYKYGFILRYPKGKDLVTGYQYEPWHYRYVGKDLAKEIFNSKKTLEEYFELGPAPTY